MRTHHGHVQQCDQRPAVPCGQQQARRVAQRPQAQQEQVVHHVGGRGQRGQRGQGPGGEGRGRGLRRCALAARRDRSAWGINVLHDATVRTTAVGRNGRAAHYMDFIKRTPTAGDLCVGLPSRLRDQACEYERQAAVVRRVVPKELDELGHDEAARQGQHQHHFV